MCSVLGILICVDVPIIYKSVSWWRTLHQPASLIEERGRTMAPEMLSVLLTSLAFTLIFCFVLWRFRLTNLHLKEQIEAASYGRLEGSS